MTKILTIFFAIVFANSTLFGQDSNKKSDFFKDYGRHLTLGFGGMASGDQDENRKYHNEFTVLNSKISLHLLPNTAVGLRNYQIWEKPPILGPYQRFSMTGLFIQYEYYRTEKLNLWVENGFYTGNYFMTSLLGSLDRPGTKVWIFGGGVDYRIFDNFFLELSLRQGYYAKKAPEISRKGEFGIVVHAGVNYRLPVKK